MKKQWASILIAASIVVSASSIVPAQALAADPTLKVVSSVNFRDQPNTSSDSIRYLKTGETAVILEKVNSYWYKIKDKNGDIGYVSSNTKYVAVQSVPAAPTPTSAPAPVPSSAAQMASKVIEAGKKYLGTPYEYGSSRLNTLTFDCSDFVRQAYLDGIGLKLPSDSRSQGEYVKKQGDIATDWSKLKPGDIMFFMEYRGTAASNYQGINKLTEKITHTAIYLGNGQILHTYSVKSGGVRIDSITGTHWEKRFLFGGSPL